MTCTLSAVSLIAACSTSTLAAESFTIADVAPANSFMVVSVPSCAKAKEAFEQSPFGKIWREPQVQEFVDKLYEEEELAKDWKRFTTWLEEAGIDQEDLHHPTGHAGVAMWVNHAEDVEKTDFGMMAMADFGEHAESMKDTLQKALDNAEKKGDIELQEDTYGEATVFTVHVLDTEDDTDDAEELEDAENGGDGEDAPFDMDDMEQEDSFKDNVEEAFEAFRLVWIDSTLIASNDQHRIEETIDHAEGQKIESIGSSSVYQRSRAQHAGEPDIFGVFVFSQDLRTLMDEAMNAMGQMMPGGGVTNIFTTLGLDKFEAASSGMDIIGETGSGEGTIGILMPEKKGLVSLFTETEGAFKPPAFVPADAASVTSFRFQFSRFFEIAKSVVGTLPEQGRDQAMAALQSFENSMGPALNALGPEVWTVRTFEHPFSETSQKSVVIVKTSDALAFVNAFGGFAPMLSMEARDFQGNPIYEDTSSDAAVGVGFGHVFFGSPVEVENLMRRASHPEEEGLVSDPRFTSAISHVDENGAVFTWSNTAATVEYAIWAMQNAERLELASLEEHAREGGYELDEDDRAMLTEHIPKWFKDIPPAEVFTKHLGDSVFSLRSTPDGFRGKTVSLPAK